MGVECLNPDCAEEINEAKLYCDRHWGQISQVKQNWIFEMWMYGAGAEGEGSRDSSRD